MILAYKFKYISTNMVLENFLKTIASEFEINYSITKDDSIVTLFVSDCEERLHKFADFIAFYLPLSIFLKSSSVEVVDEITGQNLKIDDCDFALPFTKKAITLAKDINSTFYNNPFTPNEIGLTCKDWNSSLVFSKNNNIFIANDSSAYKKVYKEVANLIAHNKTVSIKTPNGNFSFLKVSKEHLKDKNNFEIIPTDLTCVQKMVILNENEIKTLASLEKPIIKARVNSIYASKEILSKQNVKIRLPYTILLQLICEELRNIGVDFIVKISSIETSEYFLDYETFMPESNELEVSVLENNEVLILDGDGYAPINLKKNLEKLEMPSFRQLASILKERNLFDDKTSCFYFSKTHDDAILYHDGEKGMLEFVKFPVFSSIKDIFKNIENQDDTGRKLVKNYKNTFKDIYEKAINLELPDSLSNNLYTIFAFSSLILGYCDNFGNAAEKLIENAENFGGQKGPRIDFYLQDNEKIKSDFNPYKMIRSAMSFKLAGVDDQVLSFGFLESLAYFISDIADAHKETLSSSKIALAGSMFEFKILSEQSCKNLLANHKIYFNRELPIDNL